MSGFMQMVRDVAVLYKAREQEWIISDPAHVDEWVAAMARLSDYTVEDIMAADRDQLEGFMIEIDNNISLRLLLAMSKMSKGPEENLQRRNIG